MGPELKRLWGARASTLGAMARQSEEHGQFCLVIIKRVAGGGEGSCGRTAIPLGWEGVATVNVYQVLDINLQSPWWRLPGCTLCLGYLLEVVNQGTSRRRVGSVVAGARGTGHGGEAAEGSYHD